MSTVQRSVRGSLVSSIGFAAQIVQALLVVPLLLGGWGASTYAVWLSCQACVNLLLTFDNGFQNYAGNEVSKRIHADLGLARKTLGSALRFGVLLGLVEIVVALVLVRFEWLDGLLGDSASASAAVSADVVVLLSLVGFTLVGSSTGIFARVYLAQGEFVRGAWWGLFQRLAIPCVVVFVAWFGGPLVLAALLMSVLNVGVGIAFLRDGRKVLPALLPFLGRGSFRAGATVFLHSLPFVLGGLIGQLQVHGLTLAVASTLGVAAVAAFATIRTLANTLTQAAATLFAPAVPELVRLDVQRETTKLRDGLFSLNAVVNLPAALACPALILLGKPLYETWTRGQILFDRHVLYAIAASVLWRVAGLPIAGHMTAMNETRWIIISTSAQTAVLFGLAWLLSGAYGLYGVALAMLAGEVVGAVVLPNLWFALRHPAERPSWLRDQALLLVSPTISTLVLLLSAGMPQYDFALVGLGLLAQCAAVSVQLKRLPTSVKEVLGRSWDRLLQLRR
jgi:O-antigen/teichoic acid export membrane protein